MLLSLCITHKEPIMRYSELVKRVGETVSHEGGIVHKIDKWGVYYRFLIMGSMNGTFYVKPQKLTNDTFESLRDCLHADPLKYIDLLMRVSTEGRAPSNEHAIAALAFAFNEGEK